MRWLIFAATLILLMGGLSAYVANSSSYTIGSIHQGLAGSDGNSTSYTMRTTTTYQQAGNLNGTTTNYAVNVGWYDVNFTISITSIIVNTTIIYPPNLGAYGPAQCFQLVVVSTNSTAPSYTPHSTECRLYNWNGWANTTYTLNQTKTSSVSNATFNFTIPISSPPNWIVNCTETVGAVVAHTQNVSFTNVGNGPNFCNTNGTAAGENWAPIMLFLVIMALLVVGYVFFVQGIPLLLQFPEVATPLKFIYICFLVFFGTIFGMSLGSELFIFDWLVQLSMAGLVGGSIFFAIGLFRGAGDWIKANWGV